jgi:hypothetical protein
VAVVVFREIVVVFRAIALSIVSGSPRVALPPERILEMQMVVEQLALASSRTKSVLVPEY